MNTSVPPATARLDTLIVSSTLRAISRGVAVDDGTRLQRALVEALAFLGPYRDDVQRDDGGDATHREQARAGARKLARRAGRAAIAGITCVGSSRRSRLHGLS